MGQLSNRVRNFLDVKRKVVLRIIQPYNRTYELSFAIC